MKKERVLAMGLCAVMTMSLAACSGGNSSNEEGGGQLIVYTNSGSDGRDAWLKEQAAEAGLDVEVVQIPAGELGNRIISEKNNVQADMVFGLNYVVFDKLKAEDNMEKWKLEWKDEGA